MTPPSHILIVEDDAKIADMMANYLHMHGYSTEIADDGLKAMARMRSSDVAPDLLLLDLMLPGLDGLEVCQQVRTFSAVPIIMLTARVDEIDRLLGLETGADDYICKPFSPREVVARIKAHLRRATGQLVSTPPANGWQVDEPGMRVSFAGAALPLTPVEFRLFSLLHAHPGQVFGRARLLDAAHLDVRDVSDRAIDSHIKNLRKKLDAARPEGSGIVSVYGVGYRYELVSNLAP
ncbi:MAG: response regulator [Betaproteobacteria bacterium]|nr:response regulator [Betaproteobacteria bacterium]MBK7653855.1 response regulator [Betaproteobacteria bacterium]